MSEDTAARRGCKKHQCASKMGIFGSLNNCRVTPLGDDPVTDLHRTRLWLNDATGTVLRNALGLLGVSAPERM